MKKSNGLALLIIGGLGWAWSRLNGATILPGASSSLTLSLPPVSNGQAYTLSSVAPLNGSSTTPPQVPPSPAAGYVSPPPAGYTYGTSPGANPYTRASQMPILPPGTSPATAAAVKSKYEAGTLTERQAIAVSQIYAPLYNPQVAILPEEYEGPPNAGLNMSAEDILAGKGNQGYSGPPVTYEVDFGTPEAAQAALDAYMAKVREETGYGK